MIIDIKLIRYVLALAKHRNFARAADSLHISQPALSRSIAGIEHKLGVALFDRTHDGVELTTYGRLIFERGKDIVDKEDALQREIQMLQGTSIGQLSIGAAPFPFEISLAQTMIRMASSSPKLHISLETGSPPDIVNRVLAGSIDIGIADIREWQHEQRVVLEPLPQHQGVFCCRRGHPLLSIRDLTLSNILSYPMIGTVFPPALAALFSDSPIAGKVDNDTGYFLPAITVDSLDIARRITIESDAVFPVTLSIIEAKLASGELVVLDFHKPQFYSNYGFIYKKDRSLSAAASKFMAEFRQVEIGVVALEQQLTAAYIDISNRWLVPEQSAAYS